MKSLFASIFGLMFAALIVLGINSNQADAHLSPTPAPTHGSDEDSFANELNLLGIDLACQPICWNDFIVGETLAKDIYLWFYQNLSDDEYISVPYLPDFQAKNNAIAYSSMTVRLVAFSDDTQPEPVLRGFSLILPAKRLFESDLATVVSQEIVTNWSPSTVIEQYEKPTTIFISEDYVDGVDDYFMMLNYEEENFSVLYWYNPTETDVTNLDVCAEHIIESIAILVYSDAEADLSTLLDDLDDYFEFDWILHVNAIRQFDLTLLSEEEDIVGVVDQISERDCISRSNNQSPSTGD